MTTGHDTLIDLLGVDFARVCSELDTARLRVELKDSTAHRAAVDDCERAVDAVLDMFLLLDAPTTSDRQGRGTTAVGPEHCTAMA